MGQFFQFKAENESPDLKEMGSLRLVEPTICLQIHEGRIFQYFVIVSL